MEKQPTQAEKRKQEFKRHAETAKTIGDLAIREIDQVLEQSALAQAWLGPPAPNRPPALTPDTDPLPGPPPEAV